MSSYSSILGIKKPPSGGIGLEIINPALGGV